MEDYLSLLLLAAVNFAKQTWEDEGAIFFCIAGSSPQEAQAE